MVDYDPKDNEPGPTGRTAEKGADGKPTASAPPDTAKLEDRIERLEETAHVLFSIATRDMSSAERDVAFRRAFPKETA